MACWGSWGWKETDRPFCNKKRIHSLTLQVWGERSETLHLCPSLHGFHLCPQPACQESPGRKRQSFLTQGCLGPGYQGAGFSAAGLGVERLQDPSTLCLPTVSWKELQWVWPDAWERFQGYRVRACLKKKKKKEKRERRWGQGSRTWEAKARRSWIPIHLNSVVRRRKKREGEGKQRIL